MAVMTKPISKPGRPWVAIGVAVAALLAVVGLLGGGSDEAMAPSVLEVNGMTYTFEPATCQVTDDDFIVTGPGSVDDTDYVVTASATNIELAFGVSSEIDTPDASEPWWSTSGDIVWQIREGKVVVADVELLDRNHPDAPPAQAHLEVFCPTA